MLATMPLSGWRAQHGAVSSDVTVRNENIPSRLSLANILNVWCCTASCDVAPCEHDYLQQAQFNFHLLAPGTMLEDTSTTGLQGASM